MTIAIVIHAYYQKQLNYLIDKVQAVLTGSIDVDVDVYVTIPENRFCELQKMVLREMPLAKIYMVDNRGFDILPLATLADYLQKYDWVLKLHTKD
ncbi:MAG: rhamnan synthesis F family protein, partial [Streptococcus thermophilus]